MAPQFAAGCSWALLPSYFIRYFQVVSEHCLFVTCLQCCCCQARPLGGPPYSSCTHGSCRSMQRPHAAYRDQWTTRHCCHPDDSATPTGLTSLITCWCWPAEEFQPDCTSKLTTGAPAAPVSPVSCGCPGCDLTRQQCRASDSDAGEMPAVYAYTVASC
jgi:hypothetical protein